MPRRTPKAGVKPRTRKQYKRKPYTKRRTPKAGIRPIKKKTVLGMSWKMPKRRKRQSIRKVFKYRMPRKKRSTLGH